MASSSEGIVCALVARGPTILAEHSTVSGNSSLVALSILEKQAAGLQGDQRVSYLADRHAFHLLVKQGLTYLCVADQVREGGKLCTRVGMRLIVAMWKGQGV